MVYKYVLGHIQVLPLAAEIRKTFDYRVTFEYIYVIIVLFYNGSV
jgi:hypothetical protein